MIKPFMCIFFKFIFKGQTESLIKNNHCDLYKINPNYFLCRFHVDNVFMDSCSPSPIC